MSYIKAVYMTFMSMGVHYLENLCIWVKTAVWDAPRRIYLDIDLEKHRIERHLSQIETQSSSTE